MSHNSNGDAEGVGGRRMEGIGGWQVGEVGGGDADGNHGGGRRERCGPSADVGS